MCANILASFSQKSQMSELCSKIELTLIWVYIESIVIVMLEMFIDFNSLSLFPSQFLLVVTSQFLCSNTVINDDLVLT